MICREYEPEISAWQAFGRRQFIENKIVDICASIARKGAQTDFNEAFDMLYEYIEEKLPDLLMEEACNGL